jgi:AraC-like DNA-binding protein
MTRAGAFGQRHGQFLRQQEAPPSLVSHLPRGIKLAVTETRNENPDPGLSGTFAREEAYLVSLKLRDYEGCECWERGRCVIKSDIRAGATYLYDLERDPRYVIDKPYHSIFFYLTRAALDDVARQAGGSHIGELVYEPGIGSDDTILRHLGSSLLDALQRPDEVNQLFVDHTLMAVTAHVAQNYGRTWRSTEFARGGLAPWQARLACEKLESDLGGKLSLEQIAAEFDLSVGHFSRAFRVSTGLPPHQWLLHQRVKVAQQLMKVRDLPLSEIAISAGFANQSHLTRVFSNVVGVSPAAWRRDTQGAPDSDT